MSEHTSASSPSGDFTVQSVEAEAEDREEVGKIEGLESVLRNGEGNIGSHGEEPGGRHDGQNSTDTVHDGNHVG